MKLTGTRKTSDNHLRTMLSSSSSAAAVLCLLLGVTRQTAASTTSSISSYSAEPAGGTPSPTTAATALTTTTLNLTLGSPSPISSTEACEEEAETCLQEEACQSCYSDIPSLVEQIEAGQTERVSEYLDSGDSGSEVITCGILGAQFCFKNDLSPHDCLGEDTPAADYWGCLLGHYECVIDDVPCFDDVGRDDDGGETNVYGTGSFRSDDEWSGRVSAEKSGAARRFVMVDGGRGWLASTSLGSASRFVATLGLAVAAAGGALV